jgi:hypothetical protein
MKSWIFALVLTAVPLQAAAQVGVSITIAPPVLPVYAQPIIPGPGYIWTPGYWAWGPSGYFWVPGTWVLPPAVGLLWTPGYWAWRNGFYVWNVGYWGPRVGYYGGVSYGYGYVGTGYVGGYWSNSAFYYNRAVNNVNVTSIHNTYNTVVNNTTVSRVSYNGGPGGLQVRPNQSEREVMNDRHIEATSVQLSHQTAASQNRALLAAENHGRPMIAATPQAGAFDHPGIVPARVNANRANAGQPHALSTVEGSAPGAKQPQARPHREASTNGKPQESYPNVARMQVTPHGGHQQGHSQEPTNGQGGEPRGDGQRR